MARRAGVGIRRALLGIAVPLYLVFFHVLSTCNTFPIQFESLSPFAQGNFKRAFWATIEQDDFMGHKKGTRVVFKVALMHLRDANKAGVKAFEEDIKAQKMASRLAKRFNEKVKPRKFGEPCNVYMRIGKWGLMDRDVKWPNGTVVINKEEPFVIEKPIEGKFEKFNSNNGWSSGRGTLADAFSHWTWWYTHGDMLVCDVQGHRGMNGGNRYRGQNFYYLLTDPAIASTKKVFGSADLGEKGMDEWFTSHKCNSFCQRLGLHERRAAQFSFRAEQPPGVHGTKSSSAWRHTRQAGPEDEGGAGAA